MKWFVYLKKSLSYSIFNGSFHPGKFFLKAKGFLNGISSINIGLKKNKNRTRQSELLVTAFN